MTSDRDFQQMLEEALADGPEAAPMTSRAMIRGRVREVRQRPAWLVRERGDPYPRRVSPQLRMLAISVALVSLLGLTFAIGFPGSKPHLDGAPATPSITAFPVGGEPLGVAIADGAVWAGLLDQAAIVRLDPESAETTRIPSLGRNCVSMEAGAGSLWAPSCSAGPLVRLDLETNEVTDVKFGEPGQTRAPVFDGDVAWLSLDVARGVYSLFDARTDQEVVQRELSAAGHIGAIGFGSAWAMITPDGGPFRVQRLNLEDGSELASIDMTAFPDIAVASSAAIWVTTFDDASERSTLVRIDPATNDVVAVIEFEEPVLYPATDGRNVWVLAMGDIARVLRVDESANTVTEVYAIEGRADALAVDGDTLWMSRADARELVRIDLGR